MSRAILSRLRSYTYGGSDYASPGPGTGGSGYYNAAMTNYELSADYVDSTTTYDPRPTPTQVDTVAPDTGSGGASGVIPVVTTGKFSVTRFFYTFLLYFKTYCYYYFWFGIILSWLIVCLSFLGEENLIARSYTRSLYSDFIALYISSGSESFCDYVYAFLDKGCAEHSIIDTHASYASFVIKLLTCWCIYWGKSVPKIYSIYYGFKKDSNKRALEPEV